MTLVVAPDTVVPLAPVRDALVAEARAEADRLVAEADHDRQARASGARQQAATLLAQARAQGKAEAEQELAREHTAARRSAQAVVLAAQREVYETLLRSIGARVAAIADEPGYEALVRRLSAMARRRLGPSTRVLVDEGGRPGVVGEADGRRVDYTLESLAEDALRGLGPVLESLWT